MKHISYNTTLRELIAMLPDTSGEKLPTAKALRTGSSPVVFDSGEDGYGIIVYANGFFVYSDGRRSTVQSVHKCCEDIVYEYADKSYSVCDAAVFLDRPFTIRLALEGDIRLETNREVQYGRHVYSYDNLPQESVDLKDPTDIVADLLTKLDGEELYSLLERLTNKQSEVIKKYYLKGMKYLYCYGMSKFLV